MKKTPFLTLAAAAVLGLAACNNEADTTTLETTLDSGAASTTDVTTVTSTNSYAAQADSFRINSEAGVYLDARTGKPIRINVDTVTGARTNAETGEPVWRYVDNRTWWVYGGDSWDTMGSARMEANKLMYRNNDDTWATYDKRWKADDDKMMSEWKTKQKKDGDYKMENEETGTKIKVDADGDMKIKTKDGKTKIDADDGEVKTKD